MSNHDKRIACGILSLCVLLALAAPALGQRLRTLPVGTVVPLRMDTALSSSSSRVGDRFTATVFRSVLVGGRAVLPEGAKVEGHVTGISPGERGRRPGSIAVGFDTISPPNGIAISIDATLTTLSEEGRRRIEQDVRYQQGGDRVRRAVVFLGVGGGAGATIGIASDGTENTTVGGILGTLLGSGERAEVRPGAEFGMILERSFSVDSTSDRVLDDRDTGAPTQNTLSSYDSIRSAQTALRGGNYYRGPINGVMNEATREAIRNFQHDRNIAITGELDVATARALGIPGGTVGAAVIGNPRQIAFLANRLLRDFQRELNMSNNRGQVIFDTRRDFKPNEVALLFQITSLQAAAELYNDLTASITDPDAVKGAAGGLLRQARLLERIMRRDPQLRLSSTLTANLQQLQAELARINVTDATLDADIPR
jgi:peptidoglycan hydrolase-like protein with peptidoglycan-binding domain